jgi:hypothetical protein
MIHYIRTADITAPESHRRRHFIVTAPTDAAARKLIAEEQVTKNPWTKKVEGTDPAIPVVMCEPLMRIR